MQDVDARQIEDVFNLSVCFSKLFVKLSCGFVRLHSSRRKCFITGLVVMGGGSRFKGRGFESQRHILDGHDIFHINLL